jgi:hypothetical protein
VRSVYELFSRVDGAVHADDELLEFLGPKRPVRVAALITWPAPWV